MYGCPDYKTIFKLNSLRHLCMKLSMCIRGCKASSSNPCPEELKMSGCISGGLLKKISEVLEMVQLGISYSCNKAEGARSGEDMSHSNMNQRLNDNATFGRKED